MDFGFSEEQKLLRDNVRKLMDRHAPPEVVARLDREQAYPYDLYDAWVEAGLFGLPFPESPWRPRRFGHRSRHCRRRDRLHQRRPVHGLCRVSVFCGLNIVRKGSPAQIDVLGSADSVWQEAHGDLDFRAGRWLRRRRHADRRQARRRGLDHQWPETVVDRRRRARCGHQRLFEDRSQGGLPGRNVAVPGRQRHARARMPQARYARPALDRDLRAQFPGRPGRR